LKVRQIKEDETKGELVAEILIAGSQEKGGMTINMTRNDVVSRAIEIIREPKDFEGQHFNTDKMLDCLADAHKKLNEESNGGNNEQ
jgi:hypothetical protein